MDSLERKKQLLTGRKVESSQGERQLDKAAEGVGGEKKIILYTAFRTKKREEHKRKTDERIEYNNRIITPQKHFTCLHLMSAVVAQWHHHWL